MSLFLQHKHKTAGATGNHHFFAISLWVLCGLSFAVGIPSSHAIDREAELEIKRLDARIDRLSQINDQLLRDVRELQRLNEDLYKQVETLNKGHTKLEDDFVALTNTDIVNMNKKIDTAIKQDWGVFQRDCPGFANHQQIKILTKDDMVMRSLCFDGKMIHLGTEQLIQPK